MTTYICNVCGEAYLGEGKPKHCPFCGAHEAFIKEGKDATPVVEVKEDLSDLTIKNLRETLQLEIDAYAIYLCMASKSDSYEIQKMYKRLAMVEFEHATICTKILQISMPDIGPELCSDAVLENFQKTLELEDTAAHLYARFAVEAIERHVKIMFTALHQVEVDHIELIKNYL
jgi:rubrerythrin